MSDPIPSPISTRTNSNLLASSLDQNLIGNNVYSTIMDTIYGLDNISISPNPLSDHSLVKIHMGKSGYLNLILTDIYGRVIQTLSDGYFSFGDYAFDLSGSNLNPGVYFCILKTGNSKKVIKVEKML